MKGCLSETIYLVRSIQSFSTVSSLGVDGIIIAGRSRQLILLLRTSLFRVCAPCFLSLEKPITNPFQFEFFTTHTGLTPLSCLEGILFSQSSMPQLDKFTYFTQFFWLCLFFFTFYILVFVSWILVRALRQFPIYVINHMLNLNASQAPASSSSSSNSNNNRKDKRKEKEDCLRNLVFQEVDAYLTK